MKFRGFDNEIWKALKIHATKNGLSYQGQNSNVAKNNFAHCLLLKYMVSLKHDNFLS